MNNQDIIKQIRKEHGSFQTIRATTIKETNHFTTAVMKRYSSGEVLGVCGATTIYEVQFKTRTGADKLTELINNKKECKKCGKDMNKAQHSFKVNKGLCNSCFCFNTQK